MPTPFTYFEPPGKEDRLTGLWNSPASLGHVLDFSGVPYRDWNEWETFYLDEVGGALSRANTVMLCAVAEAVLGMLIEIGLIEMLEQAWPEYEDLVGEELELTPRTFVQDVFLAAANRRAPTPVTLDTLARIVEVSEHADPFLHWMTPVEISVGITLQMARRLPEWVSTYANPQTPARDLESVVHRIFPHSAFMAYVEWINAAYQSDGVQYPGSPHGWRGPLGRQVKEFLGAPQLQIHFLGWVFYSVWRHRALVIDRDRRQREREGVVPVPLSPTERFREGAPPHAHREAITTPKPIAPRPAPSRMSPIRLGQLAADLIVLGSYPYNQMSGGAYNRVVTALRNGRWPAEADVQATAATLRQRADEIQASGLGTPGTVQYLRALAKELVGGPGSVGRRRRRRR